MSILRNILAVIVGVVVGSIVNGAIIGISGSIIPRPAADVTTMEGLRATIHLFEPKHFIMPFLAHSLGAFVGALVAALIAATHKFKFAMGIGAFFLLGGIVAVMMIPCAMWFNVVDLVFAYLPMGFIAGKLAAGKS